MGDLIPMDIKGYMLDLDREEAEQPCVCDGWSSEDIIPEEDSGDEYLPPGATGKLGRESDLDFSGFSAFEEEEEEELPRVDDDSDSDGESEGDGPARPRGVGGRVCGRACGRGQRRG